VWNEGTPSSTTNHLHAARLHPHLNTPHSHSIAAKFINHHPPSCHLSSPPLHTPRSNSIAANFFYIPPPTFMPPVFTPTSHTAFSFSYCHIISTTTHLHATRLHLHLNTPHSHSIAATLYQPPPTFMPPVFTPTSYTAFPFSCCHIISTTTHLHAARLHLHLIHRVSIQLLLQQPVARFFIQALPALSKLTLGVGNGCMPSHMLHAK